MKCNYFDVFYKISKLMNKSRFLRNKKENKYSLKNPTQNMG